MSGSTREVTEGITALLAAAILLYVGFWMHNMAYADRWRTFFQGQLRDALSARTRWAMALVSFLAVYREAFEAEGFVTKMERVLVAVDESSSGRLASRLVGLLAGARRIP